MLSGVCLPLFLDSKSRATAASPRITYVQHCCGRAGACTCTHLCHGRLCGCCGISSGGQLVSWGMSFLQSGFAEGMWYSIRALYSIQHADGHIRLDFRPSEHQAGPWCIITFLLLVDIVRWRADRSCSAARKPWRLMMATVLALTAVELARMV